VCAGDGNTEVVKIKYDPNVITYEEILQKAFEVSDTSTRYTKQYASAVFPQTEQQKKVADLLLETKRSKTKRGVSTVVYDTEESNVYTRAEWYHQDYKTKNNLRIAGVLIAFVLDYASALAPPDVASVLQVLRTSLAVAVVASMLPQFVPAFDKFFG